jgi:hypothetical protein
LTTDVALVTVRNPTAQMGKMGWMRRVLKVWNMRQMWEMC